VAKGELDLVRGSYEEEKRRRDGSLRARHQELALRRQTQVGGARACFVILFFQ
jgi:hypothetical protein